MVINILPVYLPNKHSGRIALFCHTLCTLRTCVGISRDGQNTSPSNLGLDEVPVNIFVTNTLLSQITKLRNYKDFTVTDVTKVH